MEAKTQHMSIRDIKVGTKVSYKGVVGTVYRINKTIGFLSKPTYDLEVNDVSAEELFQIDK